MTDHKCLGFLLDAGEPITPGRLATLTGLTTGVITGIVDRLEGAGFVRRKRDPKDRRRVIIELNLDQVRRKVFPLFEQTRRGEGLRRDDVVDRYQGGVIGVAR